MLIPAIRYDDAPRMIDWLVEAFGFEKQVVHEGEGGRIDHAQLTFGGGMLMCGSTRDDDLPWKSAKDLPAVNQAIYIPLDDIDAHYARAREAGAEIIRELHDTDYGSRDYIAKDPEGNVWSFGTYKPEAPTS